jgi:outer membrane protein assembly factor BamD (BamD/ComL family)
MLRRLSLLLLTVVAAPAVLYAQEQSAKPRAAQSGVSACTPELFEKAERSFESRLRDSNLRVRAERDLKEVVELCADTPGHYLAEEHLRIVQEELAESNLNIALFYLKKFHDGNGRKQGALSRLRSIVERYPNYSKLDQVLSLLGQINLADNNLDAAAAYYQRIVKDFPASQYAGEASLQLSVIDAMRSGSATPNDDVR